MADPEEPNDWTSVLVRMASHALVTGAALPLDSAGTVLGAAGLVLFDATAAADRRVWKRLSGMADQVALDSGVDAPELAAWASTDDQHLQFVRDVVSTALSTLDQEKVDALGRVFTETLRDDTKLDEGQLVVSCLAQLSPVHIRVVRAMILADNPNNPEVTGAGEWGILSNHRWRWRDLCDHFPNYGAAALINVMAILERQGMITPVNDGRGNYAPTGFALLCLEYYASPTTR